MSDLSDVAGYWFGELAASAQRGSEMFNAMGEALAEAFVDRQVKVRAIVGCINYYPPEDGWEHVHVDASERGVWDAERGGTRPVDVVADMRHLPFNDGSFDEVRCDHALEHLDEQGANAALAEFQRVLTPGGVLDVTVPCLLHACHLVARSATPENVRAALGALYGDPTPMQDSELNQHRFAWTPGFLFVALYEAGFDPGANTGDREIRYRAVKR